MALERSGVYCFAANNWDTSPPSQHGNSEKDLSDPSPPRTREPSHPSPVEQLPAVDNSSRSSEVQLTLENDQTASDSPDTLATMETQEKQLRDKRLNKCRRKNNFLSPCSQTHRKLFTPPRPIPCYRSVLDRRCHRRSALRPRMKPA